MSDLIDAILDRLSPTALNRLDEIDVDADRASRLHSAELQKSLNAIEDVYLERCTREIISKTDLIKSKTREYKGLLEKYNKQFGKHQFLSVQNDNARKIKAYDQQIMGVQKQMSELAQSSCTFDPDEIFTQIIEMHEAIEGLELKNAEIMDKIKCYEGFPPNIREAQYLVMDLKEKIKEKEAVYECTLYGKS